ncbi:hypothetical protein MRY87_10940 [bacterium]|nr:hypothetical protein [bacterium]
MELASLLLLAFSASIFLFHLWLNSGPSFNNYSRAKFGAMVEGVGDKPFVMRTLIPTTSRILALPISIPARERLLAEEPLIQQFATSFLLKDPRHFPELFIALLLSYLSLLFTLLTLAALARQLLPASREQALLVIPVATAVIPLLFHEGLHYLYDLPALFFATAAMALLVKRSYLLYYCCFSVALFNKETAALFLIFFFASERKVDSRRATALHLLLHASLTLLIKGILEGVYWNNPGGAVENHFHENIETIWSAAHAFSFANAAIALLSFVLLSSFFTEKHSFLRRSLVLLPVVGAAYIYGGVWGEIRVFYECLPIIILLITDTLIRLYHLHRIPSRGEGPSRASSSFGPAIAMLSGIGSALFCIYSLSVVYGDLLHTSRASVILLSEIQKRVPVGTPWDDPRTTRISHEGLSVILPSPSRKRFVEFSADHNESYQIFFYHEDKLLGTVTAPQQPQDRGLIRHILPVPRKIRKHGYTKLLFLPQKGDSRYAIGHVRLRKSGTPLALP